MSAPHDRWTKIIKSDNEFVQQQVYQLTRNLATYPIEVDAPQGSKDVDTVFTIGIRY